MLVLGGIKYLDSAQLSGPEPGARRRSQHPGVAPARLRAPAHAIPQPDRDECCGRAGQSGCRPRRSAGSGCSPGPCCRNPGRERRHRPHRRVPSRVQRHLGRAGRGRRRVCHLQNLRSPAPRPGHRHCSREPGTGQCNREPSAWHSRGCGDACGRGLLFRVHLDLGSMFVVTMLGYLVFLAAGFAISGWVRDPQRAPVVASSIGLPLVFIGLLPTQFFPACRCRDPRTANLVRNPRSSPARAGRGMASHHDGRSGSGRVGGGPPGSRQPRVQVGPGLIRICRGHRH
jgi:hypothetical protein